MGQEEIAKLLRNNKGKWFNSEEISKEIGVSKGSINTALRRMRGFVEKRRYVRGLTRRYEYSYKEDSK